MANKKNTKPKTVKDKPKKEKAVKVKSTGLGDSIDNFTEKTGVKKAVKKIFGDDCGCKERQEKLNKMFRYKVECLTEDEYKFLDEMIKNSKTRLHVKYQARTLKIFNRIFRENIKPPCGSCNPKPWINIIKSLKRVHKQYKTELEAK